MITVETNHGTYRGRSAGSIMRRVYGRRATVLRGRWMNNDTWGWVDIPNLGVGEIPPWIYRVSE